MSSPFVPLRDGDRRRLPPSPRTVVEAAAMTETPKQGRAVEGGDTEGDARPDPGVDTDQGWATANACDGPDGQDVGGVPPEASPNRQEVRGRGVAALTAPLDDLHLWSDAALAVIRQSFAEAAARAAAWQPQPCPDIDAAAARLNSWIRP